MYGTVLAGQAYWDARGYSGTLTAVMLVKATTFVDALGWRATKTGNIVPRFPGSPAEPTQVNQWPRVDAEDVYGNAISSSVVPYSVERATYEAAWYEDQNPGSLDSSVRADEVLAKEQFGDVSFSYFPADRSGSNTSGMVRSVPVIPSVMSALAPVLTGSSNTYGITGVVA